MVIKKMKYVSDLHIIIREQQKIPVERWDIPVHSFEVEGGANRMINLKSTDEISISSEFEQARMHKNIIFYIPPTKDFLGVKLVGLRDNTLVLFELTFAISVYSGNRMTQMLRITSEFSSVRETPTPVGGTPPLLQTKIRLVRPQLFYGKFDTQRKKMVHKEI
ncbi:MAG: hypothetical protein AB1757_21635 [Acidobacteriota bacterium]